MTKRQLSTSPLGSSKRQEVITTTESSSESSLSSISDVLDDISSLSGREERSTSTSPQSSYEVKHLQNNSDNEPTSKLSSQTQKPASLGSTYSTSPCRLNVTEDQDAIRPIAGTATPSFNIDTAGLFIPDSRAVSYDGAVILPEPIHSRQPTALEALASFDASGSFPHFSSGDVVITTNLGSSSKRFQLHSAVLARYSTWFAQSIYEANIGNIRPSWYLYTIEEIDGAVTLVRQQLQVERPLITDVQVKVEEASQDVIPNGSRSLSSDSEKTIVAAQHPVNAAAVDLYAQILGVFYNITPQVSTTDIGEALIQSEGLARFATELGCLNLLRPHLSNAFAQYREKLFIAIKKDAPRWIKVALALEDTSIYTECLIHLVGAHPCWPWQTKRTVLPHELEQFVANKSEELDQLCTEIERDLLVITIETGRDQKPVSCEDRTQMESWMLVQVFRDAIAAGLHSVDKGNRKSLRRGTLYRRVHKGGSAYMEYEDVRSRCLGILQSNWRDLGGDLKILKGYASALVAEVAENQLMIDPDAHGIGYLTCTKIGPEDIPWNRTTEHVN